MDSQSQSQTQSPVGQSQSRSPEQSELPSFAVTQVSSALVLCKRKSPEAAAKKVKKVKMEELRTEPEYPKQLEEMLLTSGLGEHN